MEKKAHRLPAITRRLWLTPILAAFAVLGCACVAQASSMPWDTPLQAIVNSLQGNTAKAIGILSIVAGGAGYALTENNGGLAKVFRVILALGAISSASKILSEVFNYIGS